jgi:hypothetical protein
MQLARWHFISAVFGGRRIPSDGTPIASRTTLAAEHVFWSYATHTLSWPADVILLEMQRKLKLLILLLWMCTY